MTKRERELLEQGWVKRTVIDVFRAADFVAAYESLGFETLLEPLPTKEEGAEAGDCSECRVCFEDEQVKDRYTVMYTRKK